MVYEIIYYLIALKALCTFDTFPYDDDETGHIYDKFFYHISKYFIDYNM